MFPKIIDLRFPIIMSELNNIRRNAKLRHTFYPWLKPFISGFQNGTASNQRFAGIAFLLIISLVIIPFAAFAQDKKQLEEKRKKLLRDIEVTGNVPEGHYSKKAMQERRYELFGELFAELEARVARHLRVPGR